MYDVQQLNAMQGLRSLITCPSISLRFSRYWNFFNPSFLFFGSGINRMFSTGEAGVFLFPVLVLLPLGVDEIVRHGASPFDRVLLLGLLAAPLAPARPRWIVCYAPRTAHGRMRLAFV